MKKTVWGLEKQHAYIRLVFGGLPDSLKGKANKTKARRRLWVRLYMRDHRPRGGYPRYTERRCRPYHTYNSEEIVEENKYWCLEH